MILLSFFEVPVFLKLCPIVVGSMQKKSMVNILAFSLPEIWHFMPHDLLCHRTVIWFFWQIVTNKDFERNFQIWITVKEYLQNHEETSKTNIRRASDQKRYVIVVALDYTIVHSRGKLNPYPLLFCYRVCGL